MMALTAILSAILWMSSSSVTFVAEMKSVDIVLRQLIKKLDFDVISHGTDYNHIQISD